MSAGSNASPKSELYRFFSLDHFPGNALKARTMQLADVTRPEARGRAVARRQMMMEVKGSDNGKTYNVPWWCVMVHQEANGEGVGWEGGKSPQGASGPRGVDCRPPHVVSGVAWPEEAAAAAQ